MYSEEDHRHPPVKRHEKEKGDEEKMLIQPQHNIRHGHDVDEKMDDTSQDSVARQLESTHVTSVYDHIARHFSSTRYSPWPKVSEFLLSLPPGSLVYDIGCGNGKYAGVNPSLVMLGCDYSQELLSISRRKEGMTDVFVADVKSIPLRPNTADGIICIAVLHHLATRQHRIQGLAELVRALTAKTGQALITVWAYEQKNNDDGQESKYIKKSQRTTDSQLKKAEKGHEENNNPFGLPVHRNRTPFTSSDVLVPWKCRETGKTFLRFYHVFRQGELSSLCEDVPNVEVVREFYDEGNWCVIIRKV